MITIDLGEIEFYDDDKQEFIYEKGGIVRFEYTLRVMYEWEAKWKKPFLKGNLEDIELIDFYKMMALDPLDDRFLTTDVMTKLAEYIGNPNTATIFSSAGGESSGTSKAKVYTSEELYALMIMANVPLEFEDRNLNRLLTVLRIISNYNNPPKKMTKQEIMKQNQELNRQRRAQYNTKG